MLMLGKPMQITLRQSRGKEAVSAGSVNTKSVLLTVRVVKGFAVLQTSTVSRQFVVPPLKPRFFMVLLLVLLTSRDVTVSCIHITRL